MLKPIRLPVLREDRTIEIHLTQGYVAIIDFEDVWAAGYNWTALAVTDAHVYAANNGTLLHRLVAGVCDNGMWHVDHINGNTLDCRRSNLRTVSAKENLRNRTINSNNTSGFSGIRENKNGTWSATIAGRHLGTYASKDEAIERRLEVEKTEWGIQPRREELHTKTRAALGLGSVSNVMSAYRSRLKERSAR